LLERPISPYAVLGARVSGGNWSGGGEHSHLVFSGRREAAARTRGGSSLLCSAPFDDDGTSVHFRSKGRTEWNQGARVALLAPKVELGWPGFALAMVAATKVSGGVFWGASRGSPGRGFYRTNTGCDTQGLDQEFYLQSMISVKIFWKGMNLGRFRFEVNPTQTLMRLCVEHRIHISGWLWAS
jgi:hypothetical protein